MLMCWQPHENIERHLVSAQEPDVRADDKHVEQKILHLPPLLVGWRQHIIYALYA